MAPNFSAKEFIMPDGSNGWSECSLHVLEELKRLTTCSQDLLRQIQQISVDVAQLKIKASAWGALAGLLAVGIALGLKALS